MKNSNIKKLTVAMGTALIATSASAVDFYGYGRGGAGLSGDGEDVKYEANLLGRLGNESDFYVEFGFKQELYNEDGVSFLVDTMAATGATDSLSAAQYNIQAKGLLGGNEVLWAGKRYYQRHDVHITDFYYLNTQGQGGGMENIAGHFSVAWIQDESDKWGNGNILDLRYSNIEVNERSNIAFALLYNFTTADDAKGNDGILFTADYTAQTNGTGYNKTVFQYGSNGYAAQMPGLGAGQGYDRSSNLNDGADGFRIFNTGLVNVTDRLDISHIIMYNRASDIKYGKDEVSGDHDVFNVVVRPMYAWTKHMRTYGEVAYYDQTRGDEDTDAYKLTLSQAWSVGDDFFSRPEIRVFATYLGAGQDEESFGGDDSEYNFGIQFEGWF